MVDAPPPGEQCEVVLEVLEGVVPFVLAELARTDAVSVVDEAPTEVRVLADEPGAVLGLRTVVAAYLVVPLDVRRPRSMLSPDRVRQLADGIAVARRTARPARFEAVRFGAAGSDSPEFVRLSRRAHRRYRAPTRRRGRRPARALPAAGRALGGARPPHASTPRRRGPGGSPTTTPP